MSVQEDSLISDPKTLMAVEGPVVSKRPISDWAVLGVGLLIFWAALLFAAPPGYGWGDSGELAGTTWMMANSHPTSYPLFGPIIKLAGYLPGLKLSFGQHIFHQFLMWGGLCLLFAVASTVKGWRSAAFAVIAIGAGGYWFAQARGLEVYSLWILMMAATLFWFSRWIQHQRPRDLLLSFLTYSLLLWQFPLSLLFLPVLMSFYFLHLRWVRLFFKSGTVVSVLSFCALLPSVPYLAVVIRGAANPPLTWGMVDTPKQLLNHLMLSEYGVGLPKGAYELPDRLGLYDITLQYGPFWILVVALVIYLFITNRKAFLWTCFAGLPFAIFTGVFFHGDPQALRLPTMMALAIVLGLAAWPWLSKVSKPVALVILGIWLVIVGQSAPQQFATRDTAPEAIARQTLMDLPRNAVLVSAGEPRLSIIMSLQVLEKLRPDVLIIPESHMGVRWAYEAAKKKAPDIRWPKFPGVGSLGLFAASNIDFLSNLILNNSDKRKFYLTFFFRQLTPPFLMKPKGLVIEAVSTIHQEGPDTWKALPQMWRNDHEQKNLTTQVLASIERQTGLAFLYQGRPDLALDHFLRAEAFYPWEMEQPMNTAIAYERLEKFDAAISHYQDARLLAPGSPALDYNEALLYISRARKKKRDDPSSKDAIDDLEMAEQLLQRSLTKPEGTIPAAYQALGSVYYEENLFNDAEDAWSTALELNPGYLPAHMSLVELYIRQQRTKEITQGLSRIETLAPNTLPSLIFVAEKYLELGLNYRATKTLDRLLKLAPEHPSVKRIQETLAQLRPEMESE